MRLSSRRPAARTVLIATLLAAVLPTSAAPLRAQTPDSASGADTGAAITGFSRETAGRQRVLERLLATTPDTARARTLARALGAEPHVAGTPAQTRTADRVLRTMAEAGLDTMRLPLRVYLPFPESTVVELIRPVRRRLRLTEPALPEDPSTQGRLWPVMNGYSASGDVIGSVVYANYGLAADYRTLDSLGVSVKGKVVVARYGRSYRGIKAREAEANGALALILYSDPQDDGWFRGDVYPDGPMRPPAAAQRGSINNTRADPSTPGWPSTADARRIPRDSMQLVAIPVVPLGYGEAQAILARLRGRSVPQSWQGALPFRYHVGGTEEPRVRVGVWLQSGERAYKTIYNTFGTLRGTTWPDEMVIVGGHRDAWGHGAADNVSGVVAILEAARAWGDAARQGMGPRRTLVFATWDAEEWGLVGSTEYAELMADTLRARAVAYLNQDMSAVGRAFGASGTASLHPLLRDAARTLRHPGDTLSVYDAWRRQAPSREEEPRIGDLGGGSDFAGFYNYLGIPAFDFGFGGPIGVYHSAYDTHTFVERFADPGYLSHAAAARLSAVLLARLANADVVPLDYAAFGVYLASLLDEPARASAALGWSFDLAPLKAAADSLRLAGAAFNRARDSVLARGADSVALGRANAVLRTVEQEITREEGLPGRPGMRNLVFAADRDDGYATIALPGLAEAIRDGDERRARAEAEDLVRRVLAAARRVAEARAALHRQVTPVTSGQAGRR